MKYAPEMWANDVSRVSGSVFSFSSNNPAMVSPLESHALLMDLFHTLMVVSGSILLQDADPKQELGILRQKIVWVVLADWQHLSHL
jgi:hypothetical protein